MIEKIACELCTSQAAKDDFALELQKATSPYQRAFDLLVARRGQDAANALVRSAVLSARREAYTDLATEYPTAWYDSLETDLEGWELPGGLRALGKIVAEYPERFGGTLLTSNFDPLAEISIRRNGGTCYRTVLHRDGDISQTSATGCHVIHLHGFWVGRDTLHTAFQLNQERPRLKQWLRSLMNDSTIVVLGYGGWDDILTRSLSEVLADDAATPDILWTFHQSDDAQILQQKSDLFRLLEPGVARGRVNLYKGIDCNTFLPSLLQDLDDSRRSNRTPAGRGRASPLIEVTDHGFESSHLAIRIQIPRVPKGGHAESSPPQVDEWVGREYELALLREVSAPVVAITGLGGQGKSALAAHYLQTANAKGVFEEWDWRDCREESDRINTQLCRLIARLSAGQLDAGSVESHDAGSLIDLVFDLLAERRWLFVFDNVDHYVDLETGQFLSSVGLLFDAALSRKHNSKFVFTCRPEVRSESSRVLRLPLSGLSLEESTELFRRRGVSVDDMSDVRAAYDLTGGHPMFINMISMQVVRRQRRLQDVLQEIRRGSGELPEKTLRSIWKSLNDNQKTLLRTLAELDRPESQDRLGEIVDSMSPNRVDRALKTLKGLQLIVVKAGRGGVEVVELHPLVKTFILKEFPRQERDKFISVIVNFLDRMIVKYKGLLDRQPSFEILDHWTQKAELDINRRKYEQAIETLLEVAGPLRTRGYAEELIRIGKRLLAEIEWSKACIEYKGFDEIVHEIVETAIQFGQFEEAEGFLQRYADAVPGKSAQYINLCDLRCYLYWYQERFDQAIYWGEEGEALSTSTKVDTKYSTSHNLALARRDAGKIEPALKYFLSGKELEELLKENEGDENRGSVFGNVGRCLQFDGKLDLALVAYKKSAICLEAETDRDAALNRGYIRLWLGEVLLKKGSVELAKIFLRAAYIQWKRITPPRAKKVEDLLRGIDPALILPDSPDDSDRSDVERPIRAWLNG